MHYILNQSCFAYTYTQQQDTKTNENNMNQKDEDSSNESMESEYGLLKPDTNKCIILTKNESENEAQHQIITKLANTKKIITKYCNKKILHWLVHIV